MSDFINSRKMYLISGALLKSVTGLVQLEPDGLPVNCQYLALSERAGWWCCPFRSIPVEQFRGQSNMTERSYNYPRAECAALYPGFNVTRSAFTPLNDPVTEVWILVGVICGFIVVVVFLVSGDIQLRRGARNQRSGPNWSSIYGRAPLINATQTLSTIRDTVEEIFPDLVSDVEAASQRVAMHVHRGREVVQQQFLGRQTSTFNPRSSGTLRVVSSNPFEVSFNVRDTAL